MLPLSALRELVRRSEARLADIRDGLRTKPEEGEEDEAVKDDADAKRSLLDSSKILFEDWQRRFEDQLKTLLDTFAPFHQLQEEMVRVADVTGSPCLVTTSLGRGGRVDVWRVTPGGGRR